MKTILSGTHESQLLSEDEEISSFTYDVDTGELNTNVRKTFENVSVGFGSVMSGSSNRTVTLNDSNKYDFSQTREDAIIDDNLDYTSR